QRWRSLATVPARSGVAEEGTIDRRAGGSVAAGGAQLRRQPDHCLELQITTQALRSIARRAHALEIEAAECEKELVRLAGELAPALLEQPGIGPICAAQIICAWSHHGRLRSEAAFAALAGVAPIPTGSQRPGLLAGHLGNADRGRIRSQPCPREPSSGR